MKNVDELLQENQALRAISCRAVLRSRLALTRLVVDEAKAEGATDGC